MAAYGFADVQAAITGPGGSINFKEMGIDEGGVTFDMAEDKTSLQVGADGRPQHILHAGRHGKVTIRLQKTSPANAILMGMYVLQTRSAGTTGKNVISVRNPVSGDDYSATSVSFAKAPANTFAKEAPALEWSFNAGYIDPILGVGF